MESIYVNGNITNNISGNIILFGNINIINKNINITEKNDEDEECYPDVEFEYTTEEEILYPDTKPEECFPDAEFEYTKDEEKCYIEYIKSNTKYKKEKIEEVIITSHQQLKEDNKIIDDESSENDITIERKSVRKTKIYHEEETLEETNGKQNITKKKIKKTQIEEVEIIERKKSSSSSKKNKNLPSKLFKNVKEKKQMIISSQQIKAVKEIVEEFKQRRRWIILTAQMQSGKTTTYYLTATVMLMKRLVDKVIIFSGNNENELKIQINEDKNKLIEHLICNHSALDTFDNDMNIFELIHYIRENLIVLWGGYDMKKYEGHCSTDRVLYIWDESHAAQNKINMPAKFLKDVEISACGYQDNLEEQNSYILSVSATPFSEISDNKHEEQTKSIVNLEVDDNLYHGVKKMIEKGLIKSYRYEIWDEHLTRTLNHHKRGEPKYALVRLRENRMISGDKLVRIITNAGWKYLTFDSSKNSDIANIKTLEQQPTMHTVVILKGKCRMGKVVPKQFIAFCMETARKSDTDVILQGLLGRMCGYPKPGNPIHEVEIHLSHHVFESCDGKTEFERYIKYIQSNDTIPRRAKNILSGDIRKKSKYYPIIPIRIRFEYLDNYRGNTIRINVKNLFNQSINIHNVNISDYNNDIQKHELFERFDRIDDNTMKVRYIDDDNENTYIQAEIPNRIHHLINTRKHERVHLSYSGTKKKDKLNEEIILWVFKKSFEEYGIMQGDIFVDAETRRTTIEHIRETEETKKIPLTTKKEIFCKSDSDDEIDCDSQMENEIDYETDCTINSLDSDDEY